MPNDLTIVPFVGRFFLIKIDETKPSYNRLTETLVQEVVVDEKLLEIKKVWVVDDATHAVATTINAVTSFFKTDS